MLLSFIGCTTVMESADLAIMTFLTRFSGKSVLFDHLINAMSRLDLFKGVVLMCLFWYAWAQINPNQTVRERDERRDKLVNVLIGSILIGALSRGLQLVLNVHMRPRLSGLDLHFPLLEAGAGSLNGWNSFPSDHSMLFFALSTGLWTVNRRAGTIGFAWSLLIIDLPRIYLGIHYPSDVLAGALLGIGCMLMFQALPLRKFMSIISAWRNAHQGAFVAIMFFVADELAHLLDDVRELAHSTAHFLLHT